MEGRRVNLASISWVSVRKSIASLRCCLLVSIRSGAQSDSHFQREHRGIVWAENKKIDGIGCVDSVREGIAAHSAGHLRHLGRLYPSANLPARLHQPVPHQILGLATILEGTSESRDALAVLSGFATCGSVENERRKRALGSASTS